MKVVSFHFNCKNNPKILCTPIKFLISLKYHLKGSKWIFIQEAKIQLLEKPWENHKIWQNYQRIMSLLQSFIDKTGLMFHKYHFLNQLQVFMRYKKLPKWALIKVVTKADLTLLSCNLQVQCIKKKSVITKWQKKKENWQNEYNQWNKSSWWV